MAAPLIDPSAAPRRAGRRDGSVGAPPGVLANQGLLGLEALCALARRPLPSARRAAALGEGRRFGLHRGAAASVLVPMIVLASLVDLPLGHLAIHLRAPAAWALPLHALVVLATLWTFLWAIGLRSAVRHVDHVLRADDLVLAVAFGTTCRIPLVAVKDVHRIRGRPADWRDERRLAKRDVALVTPLDAPNLLIELRAGQGGCHLVRSGRERPVPGWVAVHVDEPESLRAALLDRRQPVGDG